MRTRAGCVNTAGWLESGQNGWIYLGFAQGVREPEIRVITAVVRGRIEGHRWIDQGWIYRPDDKFGSRAGVHFGTRFVFDKGYIYFVTGDRFPKWKHDLLAGGLAQQEVRRIRIADGKVVHQEIILKNIGRVRDVAVGPDGLVYVLLNGPDRIVRLRPAGG